jgi:hypothetical protein
MEPELPPFIESQTQESDVLHPPGIILGMLENRRNQGLGGRFLHRSNLLCEKDGPKSHHCHLGLSRGGRYLSNDSAVLSPRSLRPPAMRPGACAPAIHTAAMDRNGVP